jgi:hypothetical protein
MIQSVSRIELMRRKWSAKPSTFWSCNIISITRSHGCTSVRHLGGPCPERLSHTAPSSSLTYEVLRAKHIVVDRKTQKIERSTANLQWMTKQRQHACIHG